MLEESEELCSIVAAIARDERRNHLESWHSATSLLIANVVCSAVGCTNMIPPENAWLRRSNNDIIIGCYSSQQTWQLKCDGREWKGLVGTCPEFCELYACLLRSMSVFSQSMRKPSCKFVLLNGIFFKIINN